ncbi:bis-aminopropyl spermidine synthase family protein [Paenibacillus apiarius]|uniref:Bis-aminopropyl spermidine synthase family protein n=2 Tax=Paenibacillus apiarius TaxID=46240 RepID=A0ABT4DLT9_9BACL|nr:bis-aminopropyl spermidine synthase family protein [Paenibacillus apiarius]MBN3526144.1 bis-aminopropyl spermidine synthase family protein [Paenibacillus apiarius]MCY9518318.1 bis-aminopropyl spermidine synthase family protein [Paenibacillus apiarius]MCY9551281.1 bis-aminopropyl spermidine synthase family protein [Paenibacillus apiarius]MCY9558435.1 bis-aminopropyl spermidine synthase family protein [Paenibacillus apiarius]MCY9687136.1 bis-aminopropyl spermidine synthase family protein [Pae
MRNIIETASANVRLEEGPHVIEQLLIECYLRPGISTKEMARKTMLPVPVATAIKKELIKAGALKQDRGVHCTFAGNDYVEREWGYIGLDKELYHKLMADGMAWKSELAELLLEWNDVFHARPQVNVQIDQSKCTMETSVKRAVLCLREHSLIGKQVLCVGDDDLVSVSLGLLLKRLFPGRSSPKTGIHVVDVDERFLQHIRDIAEREDLPITCHTADLRQPLPAQLHGRFDCFFTDPPYTLQGMSLFLSRGIGALKRRKGLPVFLSFAHKSPGFTLNMQQELVRMGLMVKEITPHFNEYEGAQMIGNRGQMLVLKTTEHTTPGLTDGYEGELYTGEVNRTQRVYRCKQCGEAVLVGQDGDFGTIEQLKRRGCSGCGSSAFELIERKPASRPDERKGISFKKPRTK